jgi:hypothetical protein
MSEAGLEGKKLAPGWAGNIAKILDGWSRLLHFHRLTADGH